MRIRIRTEKSKLVLFLPGIVLLNRLSGRIFAAAAREVGVGVTDAQLERLIPLLRQYRRVHRNWVLLEVSTADGTRVEIRL